MKNLLNNTNTIAGANTNTTNNTVKGANTMNTTTINTTTNTVKGANTMRKQSNFTTIAKNAVESKMMDAYKMFDGYKNNETLMMPSKVCFANIKDMVKFLSNNYAIADATGMITEGVYRVLNASSINELSKAIKDFGKNGTELKSGQRYVEYGELVKSTHVVPRLGGGSMRVRICSKYEVQEFFNNRIVNLDINACNEEDLKAIKADMQVIGRVLQEIAIDIAKDKSLDAGVGLKEIFTFIPVLSRLIRKTDDSLVDNVKSITSMVEDAISKNPVINTGVEIESIPSYAVEVKKFDQEYIKDWASEVQENLVAATQEFFNEQVMPVVKMAGVTKEDLEIQQLVINNGECVNELDKVMQLYFSHYVRSLNEATKHSDDEMKSRVNNAKQSADKVVKEAFRDTLYAICASYGHDAAMARKLVYGATMKNGIHKASITKAMSVLGEEDMLLMWSNEEGIAVEAVKVELAEMFEELFDAEEINSMAVNFIDDVAYNSEGEEVAYGCGMTALNGEGTIIAEGNEFKFLPNKNTTVAPIGTKRVAFIDKLLDDNGVLVPFSNNGNQIVPTEVAKDRADEILGAVNAYFVPKTTDGQAINMKNIVTNVGIVVDAKDPVTGKVLTDENGNAKKLNKIVGTTVKVGAAYVNDMFIDYKEVAGEKVLANNKKHVVEQAIETKYGILLVLSC